MKKTLKKLPYLLTLLIIFLSSSGCSTIKGTAADKTGETPDKALVEWKWQLHTDENTRTGWIRAYGWVINNGSKRADWVRVSIYSIDKKTGVVVDEDSVYIQGSGPNGKSLEPGEDAKYEIRLNSKKSHHYRYERDVKWTEAY
ncbi:MAG: hypothetical protein RQ824_07620 [bacterium]|nr:hypothetical protein [bacterium]